MILSWCRDCPEYLWRLLVHHENRDSASSWLAGSVVTDRHRLIVGHAWKFKSNVFLCSALYSRWLLKKHRIVCSSFPYMWASTREDILSWLQLKAAKKIGLRTRVLTMVEVFSRSVERCFEILPDVFVQTKFANSLFYGLLRKLII